MMKLMRSLNAGSVMLVVIIVISSLMTLTTIVWYQHSLLHDIAIEKERYEKRLQLTQAVLNMGIAYVKNHAMLFWPKAKNKQPAHIVLPIATLPLCPQKSAVIQCARVKDTVRIRAFLHEQNKQIFGLQCQLTQNYEIQEWALEQM